LSLSVIFSVLRSASISNRSNCTWAWNNTVYERVQELDRRQTNLDELQLVIRAHLVLQTDTFRLQVVEEQLPFAA
jgi:hypothetical protein